MNLSPDDDSGRRDGGDNGDPLAIREASVGAKIAPAGLVLSRLARTIAFGIGGSRATTIGGWTPGLRALIGSEVLQCGCLAGTYQTCFGEVASIVDAAAEGCLHRHAANDVLGRVAEGALRTGNLAVSRAAQG